MSTVSAKDFFGGTVPTAKIPVVGTDSQLLDSQNPNDVGKTPLFTQLTDTLKSKQNPENPAAPKGGILGSIKGFGQSIGDALYAGKASKITQENQIRHAQDIKALSDFIKERKAAGEDTSRSERILQAMINMDSKDYGGDVASVIPSVNKSTKQIVGEAAGVLADTLGLAGGLGAATYGAAKGAATALENNKDLGGVALDTAKGAIIGKILEVGFNAVSPTVEKALEKYGTPLFDSIKQYIPEGVQGTFKAAADKAQGLADAATLGSGTGGTKVLDAVNAGVEKVLSPVDAAANAATKVAKVPFTILGDGAKLVKDKAGNLINQAIPPTAKENVARVLRNTGKKTLADAAGSKTIEDATQGLDIIRQNAKNITIKDIDGVEKAFDPTKATFQELPQALKQTKDAIYKQYTDLAKTAGDEGLTFGAKDFKELSSTLDKYQRKGYTKAFADKAKSLQQDLAKFGKSATPEEMQKFIEQVNLDVDTVTQKAGAQVSGDFSRQLRSMLDDKLEKSGNPAYQELRTQYSKLKVLEPDVIARYQQAMRQAGVRPDIIDNITNLDALHGLLTANPTHLAAAVGTKGIKALFQYLKNPEVNLQRAFKILGTDAEKAAATKSADGAVNDLTTTQGIFDHIKQNDGITVDPSGGLPSKGYVVAPSKSTETKIPLDKFTPEAIDAFKKKFAKQLAKPDAHLGAWNDGENIVLDVSHVVNDFSSAINLAKKGKQDAIYDLGNGSSIYTKDVLTPPKGRKAGVLQKELKNRQ